MIKICPLNTANSFLIKLANIRLLNTRVDKAVITFVSASVILVYFLKIIGILFQEMSEGEIIVVAFFWVEFKIWWVVMNVFYSVDCTLRRHMIFTLMRQKICIFDQNFIWFCRWILIFLSLAFRINGVKVLEKGRLVVLFVLEVNHEVNLNLTFDNYK